MIIISPDAMFFGCTILCDVHCRICLMAWQQIILVFNFQLLEKDFATGSIFIRGLKLLKIK